MTMPASSGAVYDRGYRPYDGPRGGRSTARWALVRASVRRALGLRRSWQQKVAPFVLLGIAVVPAIVNVGIGYVTRNSSAADFTIITYRDYVGVSTALLVFVALTAPDVVCPDRRQRVLPLIFSRQLTGADYVFAKLFAICGLLFAFSFIPQVVLYVGQTLVSDDALGYLTGHTDVLWKVPISVGLLSLYYGVIGVSVASLSSRRIVGGASIIGLFLVSSIVGGALLGDWQEGDPGSYAVLVNLLSLPLVLRDLVFLGHNDPDAPLNGTTYGAPLAIVIYVVIVGAGIAVLLRRYRWLER
jgi:ABC-2 type transport system permease protein